MGLVRSNWVQRVRPMLRWILSQLTIDDRIRPTLYYTIIRTHEQAKLERISALFRRSEFYCTVL
jgi:hypothetical protein